MQKSLNRDMDALPTIVLVGRVNVGKSTLFNRIVGGSPALVSSIPGTTRDWHERETMWNGEALRLIDTGGFGLSSSENALQPVIEEQVRTVMNRANLLLLLVDGKHGITTADRSLARMLHQSPVPCLLIVNKIDDPKRRAEIHEFWRLGLGEPHPISAATGSGVGDLLDAILARVLPLRARGDAKEHRAVSGLAQGDIVSPSERTPLRIAIIGKPNVGKSSLLNTLLGEERAIVSPIPGTTREPIDTTIDVDGKHYTFIDTAGIRRKKQKADTLEAGGIERTIAVLRRTDIALLIIESHRELDSQDLRLARTLVDARVGVVLIANKWDLFQKKSKIQNPNDQENDVKKYTTYLTAKLPHLAWAPILFVSAKTKRGAGKIFDTVTMIAEERKKMIPEEELTAWLKKLPYRRSKNKKTKKPYIYGIQQTRIEPPTFVLITEKTKLMTRRGMQKETLRESYFRFLENRLRDSFGFLGTPVVLTLRTIKKR